MSEMKTIKAGEKSYADPEEHLARGTYLRIEEDAMTAWLYLMPPEEWQQYSKDDLVRFLQHRGIVSGYHSSNLSAMIKKKVYNREIVVARGRESRDGKNGYFEFFFNAERRRAPEIREDGSVDYTTMSVLPNVHKGDKIATYHHAAPGVDGYTIYGKVMKVKPVKDLPPMRGKGVIRKNDDYYAQSDGKIETKTGKLDIQSVHVIRGDVTLIVGKVEFFGDVIIHGNVESGVTIHAGRNIEVRGTTGNATLSAGGDVILSRGIQGGGKISARGNVYADFIENTTVEAGGTIQANTILNARVYTKDMVITTGRKGCIIGGYAHGLKGIRAETVGSDTEVRTILHCGYELEDYEKFLDLRHRESEVKESLTELVNSMTFALNEKRMLGSKTSSDAEEKLASWNKQKELHFQELENIALERDRLEEIVESSEGAYISVNGEVHRNVIIGINAEQMIVNKETRFMKYSADAGVIEASVL